MELDQKIAPYDPRKVHSVEDALVALQGCSFQGRQLGIGLEVLWNMMQDTQCMKVLALSGAMIPAGMGEVVCTMIEEGIVDAIVSTGANITHDLVNVFGGGQVHYVGYADADDDELCRREINRIYDTFLPEDKYKIARVEETDILKAHYGDGQAIATPSAIFDVLGKAIKVRSVVKVAADHDVPIFCGASSDSDLGLAIAESREKGKLDLYLDEVGDIIKFSKIINSHATAGTIIVGGGVPRNWAQQIFPYLRQRDILRPNEEYGYNYSVRMHTAMEYDGGLSGCTISESKSWGKYVKGAKHASIWVDATIALPLLITAVVQRKRAGQ